MLIIRKSTFSQKVTVNRHQISASNAVCKTVFILATLRYMKLFKNSNFWPHCDIRVKQCMAGKGKWLSNYFHRSLFFIVFLLIKRDEKGALVSKRSKQGLLYQVPTIGVRILKQQ